MNIVTDPSTYAACKYTSSLHLPPSPQPGGDLQESGIATLDLSPFTVMKTPAKGFDDSTHASLDSSRFSTASRDTLRDLSLREKGAARKEAEV